MYHVENPAGRLVEVKLASPLSVEEVQQFAQKHIAIMQKIPGGKYVGVVNLLEAYVFPPAVAEALAKLLSGAGSHVERSAFLIGESAVFGLQVERVIRDANNPNRRAFRHGPELVTWLSEVLNFAERRELERFVREATSLVRH
jgi:hypothetical protein